MADALDNATTVRLEALAENEAAALLERALRARLVDERTGRRALEAAEGNPFFLEQLLAIHAEHGEQLDVPPTVHAVLAARIDRLPPAERTVAQRTSVQGRAFSRRALAELVSDQHLATLDVTLGALQRREPFQRDPRAFGGADGLRFSHGLIRDAAYQFLPEETRSELHERLALWLDRAAEQPLGEQEEVIDYHLEQAYRYRAELGRVGHASAPSAPRAPDGSTRRVAAPSLGATCPPPSSSWSVPRRAWRATIGPERSPSRARRRAHRGREAVRGRPGPRGGD